MRDNQQAMKLSRRAVIASLAAGAVANVPVIAAVAGGDHPDRELLGLVNTFGSGQPSARRTSTPPGARARSGRALRPVL